jgi:hypothetical protein
MKKTESEKKNSKFEILNSKQIQNLNIQNVLDFGYWGCFRI